MKILLLTTHLNVGGVSTYTINLAKYIKAEGIDISVASSGGELVRELKKHDIKHFKIDIKTKFAFGYKVIRNINPLLKIIRENNIDIVHAQTRVTQVLASIVKKVSKIQYISTCHGFFKHNNFGRKIYPAWGDKVIAISESVKKHLIRDFRAKPEKVVKVFNGIELGKYEGVSKEKDEPFLLEIGLSKKEMIVGSIGRLSSVKGYSYLIDAFRDIAREIDDVYLLLVGDGPEKERLKQQIKKLALEDKVIINPGGQNLSKFFSVIDIFCLPSISEGFGLALVEAMAFGRACIASNVGGLSELIINGEDGLLFDAKSPESIKKAVMVLIKDPDKRKLFSQKGQIKVRNEFSIEKCVHETIKVYKSVMR